MTPLDQQFHRFAKELDIQDSPELEKFRQCFYAGCLITLIRCEDHMQPKDSETIFDTINHEYHTPQKLLPWLVLALMLGLAVLHPGDFTRNINLITKPYSR